MDNRRIDITAQSEEDFKLAMQLISRTSFNKHEAVGFAIVDNTFLLYWTESDKMHPLPYKMNVDQVTAFVWGWLKGARPNSKEPDHDGDNHVGFRVFNEAWGHVCSQSQVYAGITPIWAMYGK